MKRWLFLLAALLALPAAADIYKCRLPNGKMEISNTPCPSGSGTVVARPDESVPEATRQQAERDVERMRNYVDKREAAQRADEAAERQERASQRQAASAGQLSRSYGDPAACLRELDQQALEATQRSQLEAECRSRIKPPAEIPQPVYVPMYGAPPHHHPRPPALPKPETPSAPSVIFCPPANKNCAR